MVPGEKTKQIWRDVESATSGSSGCSGADARQADKRNRLCNSHDCQELGKCNAFEPEVECPVYSLCSEVSDRSSDGLLCPFCRAELEFESASGSGGTIHVERYECRKCGAKCDKRSRQ